MAKVILIDGDRTFEMEGEAVLAFVTNPAVQGGDDKIPNAMTLMVGSGSTGKIMKTVSSCMGSLLSQMVTDPVEQIVLVRKMTQYFTDGIFGIGTDTEVQEKQMTPIKEED